MNPFLHDTVAQPLQGDDANPRTETPKATTSIRSVVCGDLRVLRANVRQPQRLRARSVGFCRRTLTPRVGALGVVAGLAAGVMLPASAVASEIDMKPFGAVTRKGVDANDANATQLLGVRGIGPKLADAIVSERRRAGPCASMQDLTERVKGIGDRKAARLKAGGLKFGPASTLPSNSSSR